MPTLPTHGRKLNVRRLTVLALLASLMLLFAFTPVGFITITPTVAITVMHIPVLVGMLCEGFGAGLFLSFLFGLFSLLRALTPTGALDPLFVNPLVSIVPRMLIPCVAWGAYRGVLMLAHDRTGKRPMAWAAAGLMGTLTNTVGVLGMIYLVYRDRAAEIFGTAASALMAALAGVVLTNGIPEAVFAMIVVPVVLEALTQRRMVLPGETPRAPKTKETEE